jgi:hypothetical protein
LLKGSSASRPNPSTSHGRETIHDGLGGCRIAEEVQREVNDVDMTLFSVAYVSGFIARHVLPAVRWDDCKACLTSPVMLSTNAFIYFKEYRNNEQSLTYPSERLVETVSASVTVLESMMAEVAHKYSVEEKITAAITTTVDFGWIESSGCSLHQEILASYSCKKGPCASQTKRIWRTTTRAYMTLWRAICYTVKSTMLKQMEIKIVRLHTLRLQHVTIDNEHQNVILKDLPLPPPDAESSTGQDDPQTAGR